MNYIANQRPKSRLSHYAIAAILVLSVALCIAVFMFYSKPSNAVTGADWRAGNIIDDAIFYDGSDMSAADIQRFLESKVPVCDTDGSEPSEFGGGTRADYGRSRGYPPPFVCLKDYYEHPTTKANNLAGRSRPSGSLSAAQIIKRAADTYDISARALIVTLQKESPGPLVTDDWPLSIQYRNAMGYGCPDTAPCDPQFEGFYNQVHNAARQFTIYAENPNNYRHKPFQTNAVLFNPSSSCGSTNVNIQTRATAGLYNYTPYQPNKAALDNLYGAGNSCSAYGNRNFWRLFSDWFGSTDSNIPKYEAQLNATSGKVTLEPGETTYAAIRLKNTGFENWYDDYAVNTGQAPPNTKPVRLGTSHNVHRESIFAGGRWQAGGNRPSVNFAAVYEADGSTLAANQHIVERDQIVRFGFILTAPAETAPRTYREAFRPVFEGGHYMNYPGSYIDVTFKPDYSLSRVEQFQDPTLAKGDQHYGFIRYKNTGSTPWYDDEAIRSDVAPSYERPFRLRTYGTGRESSFGIKWTRNRDTPSINFAAVYEADGQTLSGNQRVVRTGQIAQFGFVMVVPSSKNPGTYREYFALNKIGTGAITGSGFFSDITVLADYKQQWVGQSEFPTINRGQSVYGHVLYKNTGVKAWYDDAAIGQGMAPAGTKPMRLGTSPIGRSSPLGIKWTRNRDTPSINFAAVYEADGQTLSGNQRVVEPGQVAKFGFVFHAPNNLRTGTYTEFFRPVINDKGVAGSGVYLRVTVR